MVYTIPQVRLSPQMSLGYGEVMLKLPSTGAHVEIHSVTSKEDSNFQCDLSFTTIILSRNQKQGK